MQPSSPGRRRGPALLGIAAVLAGALGIAAIWTVVNLFTLRFNGWMALLAAADAVALLRLAGHPGGTARGVLAAVATVLTALIAAYLTAALRVGAAFGLQPAEAVSRMGLSFAWDFLRGGLHGWDLALVAIAILLAWRFGR